MGYLYILNNRYNEARDVLEKAVNLNPPVAYIYNNLAISHENLSEYEKARQYYQQALEVDPGYEKARINLERIKDL